MTLRNLACVAMAALALIMADATTARAVIQICDVMPSRCYYGSDGRFYYTPPGHPMPDFTKTPRGGAAQSPNKAAWGCFATDGKARGRSWGFPNRASALYGALSQCTKISTRGSCRVVGCRPSIHTNYESQAIWLTGMHR